MNNKKTKHKAGTTKSKKRLPSPPARRAGDVPGKAPCAPGSFLQKVRNRILIAVAVAFVCAAGIWAIVFFAGESTPSSNSHSVVNSGNIKISQVDISEITEKTITVKWKTTVPSTSQVMARERSSGEVIAGWPDKELVTDHTFVVSGLAPDTVYNLTIKSIDGSGNEAELELQEHVATRPVRRSTELAQGMEAPDFALETLAGNDVSLDDFEGKQVIVVFWEITCASCKEQLPLMQEFFSRMNSEEYMLLTVSVRGRQALIESYAAGNGFTFPILLDGEGVVAEQYTIAIYPTTFLIDGEGTIADIRESSFATLADIEHFLKGNGTTGAANN